MTQFLPASFLPYLKLMRLHQPTGIWLLLWPCLWSIGFASYEQINVVLLALFSIGAVVMRAAGCIVNDIWDRDIDAHVARTASRPLASGETGIKEAIALVVLLTAIGAIVLFSMNQLTIMLGLLSLGFVVLYPLMKRWFFMPQLFLGITFNWGVLMGWASVRGSLSIVPCILYFACILWTLAYDTIYAHQDKDDDELLGLQSTALLWGDNTKTYVQGLYKALGLLLLLMGAVTQMEVTYYMVLTLAFWQLYWQVTSLNTDDSKLCGAIFKSNATFGWIVMAAIVAGHFHIFT